MSRTRGSSFLGNLDYLEKTFGADAMQRVSKTLNSEDRELFTNAIVPISWLDTQAAFRFYVAADKLFGKGDLELVKKMAAHAAETHAKGLYRFLLPMLNVETILKVAGIFWNRYYDRGKLWSEKRGERQVEIFLSGIDDLPPAHSANIGAYIGKFIEMTKGRNGRVVETKCQGKGDPMCQFTCTWE